MGHMIPHFEPTTNPIHIRHPTLWSISECLDDSTREGQCWIKSTNWLGHTSVRSSSCVWRVNLSFSPDGGENGGLLGGRGSPRENTEKRTGYTSPSVLWRQLIFLLWCFFLLRALRLFLASNLHQHMMRQRLRTFLIWSHNQQRWRLGTRRFSKFVPCTVSNKIQRKVNTPWRFFVAAHYSRQRIQTVWINSR